MSTALAILIAGTLIAMTAWLGAVVWITRNDRIKPMQTSHDADNVSIALR